MDATVVVTDVGWRAHAALREARGCTRRLATLSESLYLVVAGHVLWLGRSGAALHGRAALVPALPLGDDDVKLDVSRARRWWAPPLGAAPLAVIAAGCRTLVSAITALGEPQGFGIWLTGGTPPFPLAAAGAAPSALAAACVADDSRRALGAARALIGLGPGLTPAGDDYVGGAFFARALLGPGATRDGPGWTQAAASVKALAAERTHPISAVLLADLVSGEGHAPLHDLARGLATGAPVVDTLAAAHRLTRIGHSSGWDILAGFMGAILGPPRGGPLRGSAVE